MKKTYIEPVVAMSELENENIIATSEIIPGGGIRENGAGDWADSREDKLEIGGIEVDW